ncbi:hypothetical protein ACFVT5_31395 [Streptomyces sp. NPDC058001]|uniref:hypothetical protein n=1 Tax=Streptomyces sp. NPDC058001 TaxID=3346300 RepID=UPI0036E26655
MISIKTRSISTTKMTDRSVVASCLLGLSNQGTGVSGVAAVRPVSNLALAGLPIRERNERPTQAPEAVAATKAQAYAFAATGAGSSSKTQHHSMWAFRGLEPWSDPA